MSFGWQPSPTRSDANECRRSWKRTCGRPARRSAGRNSRSTTLCPSSGVPFWGAEDEIVLVLEEARHPVPAKRGDEHRRHGDRPRRARRLRALEGPVSIEPPSHPQARALPVDVAPPEREELAAAHPRRDGTQEERPRFRPGRLEEPRDLVRTEHVYVLPLDARPAYVRGRVRREELPLDRVPARARAENRSLQTPTRSNPEI